MQVDTVEIRWFCRGCGYDLRALMQPRCPECGREFNPEDRRTFRTRPLRRWGWINRIGLALAILALLLTGTGWEVYAGWKADQEAGRSLRVYRQPLGGDKLKALLGPWGKYLDRVVTVDDGGPASMPVSRFEAIAKLSHLESLNVCSPSLTNEKVAPLAGLTQLKYLTLVAARFDDEGLGQLKGNRNLEALTLGGSNFTGSALAEFDLRSVRTLRLMGNKIDDSALVGLGQCARLENFVLMADKVTDAGLVRLKGLHNLQAVQIRSTAVTGHTLAELDFQQLRSLSLMNSGVDDAALPALAGCEKLETLDLSYCKITDEGLRALKPLKSLTKFDVHGNATTEAGRAELQAALPALKITW